MSAPSTIKPSGTRGSQIRRFEGVLAGRDPKEHLLGLYLRNGPSLLACLKRASLDEDWELLKQAAHALASSSRTFGVEQVAQDCEALQKAADEHIEVDSLRPLLEQAEADFHQAAQSFSHHLGIASPTHASFPSGTSLDS